jgi:NAD(P)-dependent dehydrogenase (short-subunit alcohol dehydrogenase family)
VVIADVSKLKEVEQMIEKAVNDLGPLNTFIANAGIAQVKGLLELTEEDFQRMFAVNVFGVQNSCQAAAKQLIKQGNCSAEAPGKIVTVHYPLPFPAFFPPY